MGTKHTKGPWHMGIGNGCGSIFGPEDCGRAKMTDKGTSLAPICLMITGFGGVVHRDKMTDEDRANAQLLASSPELFEACEAGALSMHHPACSHGKQGNGNTCDCHVKLCQQAISKATNSQPEG